MFKPSVPDKWSPRLESTVQTRLISAYTAMYARKIRKSECEDRHKQQQQFQRRAFVASVGVDVDRGTGVETAGHNPGEAARQLRTDHDRMQQMPAAVAAPTTAADVWRGPTRDSQYFSAGFLIIDS